MRVGCTLALSAILCGGAARAELFFGDPVPLPDGITLPVLSGAWGVPLAPTNLFYRAVGPLSDTNRPVLLLRQRADAIWHATQQVAEWVDPDGNRMVLGRVNSRFPETPTPPLWVEFASCEGTVPGGPTKTKTEFSRQDVGEWMGRFASGRVQTRGRVVPERNVHLADILNFPAHAAGRLFAYAFRFRDGKQYPSGWFALLIAPSTNSVASRSAIERDVIARIEGNSLFSESTSSPFYADLASDPLRVFAFRGVLNLPDWWAIDSDNYVLVYDNAAVSAFADTLLAEVQAVRAYFPYLVPEYDSAVDDVLPVRIFGDRAEYDLYAPERLRRYGGYYNPSQIEAVIRPKNGAHQCYSSYLGIVLHEVFHHYMGLAVGHVSTWLNEGFAEYFETARVGDEGMIVSDDNCRFHSTVDLVTRNETSKKVPRLLAMTHEQFHTNTCDQTESENYVLSWSLVFYLQQGVRPNHPQRYDRILDRYFVEFRKTGDPEQATRHAFGDVNMNGFLSAYNSFWLELARERRALGRPLGEPPDTCECEVCEEARRTRPAHGPPEAPLSQPIVAPAVAPPVSQSAPTMFAIRSPSTHLELPPAGHRPDEADDSPNTIRPSTSRAAVGTARSNTPAITVGAMVAAGLLVGLFRRRRHGGRPA